MTPSPLGSSMSASFSDSGPLSSTIWIARMRSTIRAIVRGMSATAVNERLAALTAAGTSIWLDQLSRGLIETGELARMVEQDSLQGVTSNPAIFEKSILGSADYDDDLKRLADEGKSAREIYRAMALHDVRAAADVLRPVYDRTNGVDGYVSWEVAPRLAHDTAGHARAGPHVLGPGRPPEPDDQDPGDAGGHAGDRAGAVRRHEHQRHAAVRGRAVRGRDGGLRPRDGAPAGGGRPLDRHSVASFFVSRVDTEVDKRLEAAGQHRAAGPAGLANARAAYQAFQRVFEGERFAKLREAGCPVQRPLWASTGVKNPAYPPTLYVWGLVAPHTVNTMPMPTLQAARDERRRHRRDRRRGPVRRPGGAGRRGHRPRRRHRQLLREGIDAFMVPMQKLLDGIETKRAEIAA